MCSLQRVVEAATGQSWIMEGEGMVPQATRRHVSPHTICECWPPEHSIIPKEPVDEIRAVVTQHLDEDAMGKLSNIAWDMLRVRTLMRAIGRRTVCPILWG